MTIVACSSAPAVPSINGANGAATPRDLGRVIVRLSGPQAFALASTVFVAQDEQPLTAFGRAWSRVDGAIAWRGHRLAACAYCMRAPHSYTCEHIVELHIPALPWVLADLLERLIAAGARAAEPGEFTRRAFENGRITLDQAQAIGALIQARSAEEARVHASRLDAHGHSRLANLRSGIEALLSLVELGLDFSHEDVGVLSVAEMLERLKRLHEQSVELSGAEQSGGAPLSTAELHTLLPRVVLIGPMNAGKSSLFNRLLERDAAIVSPSAHTTRDVVEAPLGLPGGACVLCDTAGFAAPGAVLPLPSQGRGPGGEVKAAAQNLARQAAAHANAILIVLDIAEAVDGQTEEEIRRALEQNPMAKAAVVWSKVDLQANLGPQPRANLTPRPPSLRGKGEKGNNDSGAAGGDSMVEFRVSSRTGEGVPALREFLNQAVLLASAEHASANTSAAASGAVAVRTAAAALERAHAGLLAGDGEDIVAVELREALHAFWQAEGRLVRHDAVTEAMLDRIFAAFCIGK